MRPRIAVLLRLKREGSCITCSTIYVTTQKNFPKCRFFFFFFWFWPSHSNKQRNSSLRTIKHLTTSESINVGQDFLHIKNIQDVFYRSSKPTRIRLVSLRSKSVAAAPAQELWHQWACMYQRHSVSISKQTILQKWINQESM